MEILEVEHALRKAVKQRRDFDHCAGYLEGIFGKLSLSREKYDGLLKELKEFFDTYKSGSI